MGSKFQIPRTFSSATEMFAAAKPDFVIIGTPPASHFELCQEALQAGAHVFCEKPFMQTIEEADAVIQTARSRNLLLRVNNQYRFMSFFAETKRRLERGDFGRAFYLQAWQQMFHPPAYENNWRNTLTHYLLFEFATHALDLACFLFGGLPETVSAVIPRVRAEYDSDVLVHMTLRFPGERLAVFSFNRISHAPQRYLEMRLECEDASVRITLGGQARFGLEWSSDARRPVVRAGFFKGGEARVEKDGRSRSICTSAKPEFAAATARHLRLFLTEMQAPVRDLSAAEHSREVLRLVFAGYESAATGSIIELGRPSVRS
jgi:predicted dehydrogenase